MPEYFEQQTNCSRYRKKLSQQRRILSWRNQWCLPFLSKQIKIIPLNHKQSVTQLQNDIFNFSEFLNNYGLKRGTIQQIVIFIPQFPLKLYMQFWKYFHSMILGRLARGYCKENNFSQKFCLQGLSAFNISLILHKNIWEPSKSSLDLLQF